jgi:2-oxoglutarate dehydrogenase E2 component (dihydrolipoamide succinyltransferase)
MATDVVMPQMGESIAEGTIVRWIKKVGDKVDRDEPLFEISTDKVDAEIPSPAAGVVTEIRVREGETVPVNSVVAVIGEASEATAVSPPKAAAETQPAAKTAVGTPAAPSAPAPPPAPSPQADGTPAATEQTGTPPREPQAVAQSDGVAAKAAEPSTEETIHQRSSPLVRQLAKEHHVDISQIRGTGISGRVTKGDILGYLEERKGKGGAVPGDSKPAPAPEAPRAKVGEPGRTERLSVMRKKIAEHMIASRRTSAHVHSVFEVNFSRVAQIREAKKAEYEAAGAKLTYLSFIIKAVVGALREMPIVNASIDGDNVVYHKDVNVGIAVALDWGLIVPVIKKADEKNLLGLSRAVADLANRARAKQLSPDDVAGGTFTITNPGVFGALFGMPIINQPQVAILGVGNIEKRPVVIDDAIAIRPMAYLTLGYDHRLIDGAVADQFMSLIKAKLEHWDPADA